MDFCQQVYKISFMTDPSAECGCASVQELFEGGVNILQLKRVLACNVNSKAEEIKEILYTNILVSSITFSDTDIDTNRRVCIWVLTEHDCMKVFTAGTETIWYSIYHVSTFHPPFPSLPSPISFPFHSTPSYSLFLSPSFSPPLSPPLSPPVFSVPSAPPVIPGLCTVVVWNTPSQMNGVLTGYDLRFYDANREIIVSNSSDEILRIVQNTDIPTRRERTFVQVSMCIA